MAEQGRLVWHLQRRQPLVAADERPGEGSFLHHGKVGFTVVSPLQLLHGVVVASIEVFYVCELSCL